MGTKNYKIILVLFLALIAGTNGLMAQKQSEKLKKKQREIQKKIENTKGLLSRTRDGQKLTIAELAIINQQIAYRDELITNYAQQVNKISTEIVQHSNDIFRLQGELEKLKKRYVELVRYAYRHRNSYHRLLFVFASGSFNQAYVRVKYLRQFADHRKKQAQLIREKQRALNSKVLQLKGDKVSKQDLLVKQEDEKKNHLQDKNKQQESLSKLKSEEKQLKEELTEQEKQKERLALEIKKAIEEEVRKERERERQREIERKRTADKNKTPNKTSNKTNPETNKTPNKVNYDISRDGMELESAEFEKNRGRLPWPVEKGEIISHFGKNPHPTLAGVFTNNNGIDIGTAKGASVRSVFGGKVSSVFVIPNAGKCVIISHGVYRTVYANLAEVSVSKGQEIKTKQVIGKLLPGDEGNLSESHFEIWKVTSDDMEKQNPGLWLYK